MIFGSDTLEFMKPVQNSVDEEETDSLLLQSNLEYSNGNYASTSVLNKNTYG